MLVYLDYNATTPVHPSVQKKVIAVLKDNWANPSSSYEAGRTSKDIIEASRSEIADLIGSTSDEILFTSGGTESNNMVLHTAIKHFESKMLTNINGNVLSKKPHVISTNIEHDSIKLPLERFSKDDRIEVTYVPVSRQTGAVNVQDIISEIRPNTCLITVMLANNETGVIQPVSLIKHNLRSSNFKNILLHTDAAQAIGKIHVNVEELGVDYLTIVGHKFYGPRNGALYFRKSSPLYPMLYGGGQENNLRPGTENTCLIAGLGAAAELVNSNLEKYSSHMISMRDYLENALKQTFKDKVIFNFKAEHSRLPNTLSVAFDYNITGKQLLTEASNICASTGAACHSGGKPSSVLIASGVTESLASKTLRLSVGINTTEKEIDSAVFQLKEAVNKLI